MFNVKGKVTCITGGTSGLGLATAKRLVAAGARVFILGRRTTGAEIGDNIGASFLKADVTQEDELISALEAIVAAHGPLDIVFNNAGIENAGSTIQDTDSVEFHRILEINLIGTYNVLRHSSERMNDGGSIINTASAAGLTQLPGYAQYSATKAALISLTKTAALELASRHIRVNAICPGSVWSEMLKEGHPEIDIIKVLCPANRIGDPEEVAALVHFLGSDDSKYISGAAIPIDGGVLAGFSYGILEKITVQEEE